MLMKQKQKQKKIIKDQLCDSSLCHVIRRIISEDNAQLQPFKRKKIVLSDDFVNAIKEAATYLDKASSAFEDARVKASNDDVSESVDSLNESTRRCSVT